jgi:hypothetical protein
MRGGELLIITFVVRSTPLAKRHRGSVHEQDGPRMSTTLQTVGVERSAEHGAAADSASCASMTMSVELES